MAQEGGGPLIGSRISLISKKGIRYEGVLFTIDTEHATLALQNVNIYGTENRTTSGTPIPPSFKIQPFLTFRGQDIKDLHVHDAQDESPAPANQSTPAFPQQTPADSTTLLIPEVVSGAPPQPPLPPAQVQHQPPPGTALPQQTHPQPPANVVSPAVPVEVPALEPAAAIHKGKPQMAQEVDGEASPRKKGRGSEPGPGMSQTGHGEGQPAQQQQRRQAQQYQQQLSGGARARGEKVRAGGTGSGAAAGGRAGAPNGGNAAVGGGRGGGGHGTRPAGPMVGTGEALLNLRTRGGQVPQESSATTPAEFDFQSELQKFDKEELAKEMGSLMLDQGAGPGSTEGGGEVKKYSKSSFFDEISCDMLDRAQGRQPRHVSRAAEMDVNLETFGTTGLQHARRRGGRGRGRAGGYRNRGGGSGDRGTAGDGTSSGGGGGRSNSGVGRGSGSRPRGGRRGGRGGQV